MFHFVLVRVRLVRVVRLAKGGTPKEKQKHDLTLVGSQLLAVTPAKTQDGCNVLTPDGKSWMSTVCIPNQSKVPFMLS